MLFDSYFFINSFLIRRIVFSFQVCSINRYHRIIYFVKNKKTKNAIIIRTT